jgi:hypothetical protein
MIGRGIRRLKYHLRRGLRPETCKVCWRDSGISFHVPEDIYERVCQGRTWPSPFGGKMDTASLCLVCFDQRARQKGIPYWDRLLVFGHQSWMVPDYSVRAEDVHAIYYLNDWQRPGRTTASG